MYKISYIGDDAATEFLFAFPLFQEADVRVSVDDKLLDDSQYDVNVNEEFDGGYVTLAVPPREGARIDVFRQISLTRVVDYQPTAKIDPENLNTDFNFLLEAFRDLRAIDIDLTEWKNVHDNLLSFIKYTIDVIEDKLSGGHVLGLYKNLLSVLDKALPQLINDYGSVAEAVPNENQDDYGIL
jgi:hypothetical protein